MRKLILLLLFCTGVGAISGQQNDHQEAFRQLQERGEVYFSFSSSDQDIPYLSRIISIDTRENDRILAYANSKTFPVFLELGIDYKLLTPPSMLHQPFMLDGRAALNRSEWDFYPTYQGYLDIMNQFAADYPDLCELVNIETLSSGRELLFIHINDNLGVDQDEPEFMYTASMHGDETSGYVLSLHLIDHLLENYGSDEQITNLVENLDIWINPLANPDGTYAGGNNTVFGATRGNANGVDLNRNYPDFEDGSNPDGNEWQEETVAFMDFAEEHDFVMSANLHDGTEVCNYPWDTWSKRHPDDDWWIYVCRQFADTVQKYSPPGYFTDLNNGITNGYDWYTISGGRQDYMNWYHHCREFTLEIWSQKLVPASLLENIWEYQHRSLLNYMEQALYGVRGLVTNGVNGNPVPAKVFVEDHDEDESHVFASLPVGNYHRPIKAGNYDFTFSSFGYYSKTIEDVTPQDMNTLLLDVELEPYQSLSADFYASDTIIPIGDSVDFFDVSTGADIVSWEWTFPGGIPSGSTEQNPRNIAYPEAGLYDVTLTVTDEEGDFSTQTKQQYIRVTEIFPMKDTTVYLCDGLFYDTGGADAEYGNGEDITMTFISMLESGRLKITFREFDVETQADCGFDYLEAFEGSDVNGTFLGKWCGTDLPPTLVIESIEAAITFRFHSNTVITRPGWKAEITCDTSVGKMEWPDEKLSLYPNPSTDQVLVEMHRNTKNIQILSLTGEVVFSLDGPPEKLLLNTADWHPGVYFVVTRRGSQVTYGKLLVQ